MTTKKYYMAHGGEQYRRLKKSGICVQCKVKPSLKDKVLCKSCREKRILRYQKIKEQRKLYKEQNKYKWYV